MQTRKINDVFSTFAYSPEITQDSQDSKRLSNIEIDGTMDNLHNVIMETAKRNLHA